MTELGENLKAMRLMRNINQVTLAARAGISVSAVKGLENGRGATVKTLVRVVRALDRQQWLANVAPMASINPLTLVRNGAQRQRARRSTTKSRSGVVKLEI